MWSIFKRKDRSKKSISSSSMECETHSVSSKPAAREKDASLSAEKILHFYEIAQRIVTPDVDAALESREARQRLYKLLLRQPVVLYASLIRRAFAKEVEYREALWHRTVEDDGDCYEGIYRCAFLLYRVGCLDDIQTLWTAKYMNMDVGTSMGAEFFNGPGLEPTLSYLAESTLSDSGQISEYIKDWFSHDDAKNWQKSWENDMESNIENSTH